MNHYAARELENKVGFWHYTCTNGDRTYPVGYCKDCSGHLTKEKAENHFKEYLLDKMSVIEKKNEWPKHKCDFKECNKEAKNCVNLLGYVYYELCEDHSNKESVNVIHEVHESWSS